MICKYLLGRGVIQENNLGVRRDKCSESNPKLSKLGSAMGLGGTVSPLNGGVRGRSSVTKTYTLT